MCFVESEDRLVHIFYFPCKTEKHLLCRKLSRIYIRVSCGLLIKCEERLSSDQLGLVAGGGGGEAVTMATALGGNNSQGPAQSLGSSGTTITVVATAQGNQTILQVSFTVSLHFTDPIVEHYIMITWENCKLNTNCGSDVS